MWWSKNFEAKNRNFKRIVCVKIIMQNSPIGKRRFLLDNLFHRIRRRLFFIWRDRQQQSAFLVQYSFSANNTNTKKMRTVIFILHSSSLFGIQCCDSIYICFLFSLFLLFFDLLSLENLHFPIRLSILSFLLKSNWISDSLELFNAHFSLYFLLSEDLWKCILLSHSIETEIKLE